MVVGLPRWPQGCSAGTVIWWPTNQTELDNDFDHMILATNHLWLSLIGIRFSSFSWRCWSYSFTNSIYSYILLCLFGTKLSASHLYTSRWRVWQAERNTSWAELGAYFDAVSLNWGALLRSEIWLLNCFAPGWVRKGFRSRKRLIA